MVKLVNRAYVSTATTGTGTITLGAAEPGQQTFASAGILNGDTVRYTIEDGTAWEIGTGTYSSTGPTLTRTATESSAAGAEINLSGAARVYVTVAAGDLQKAADMDQGVATTDSPSFAGLTVDTNTLYVDAVDNRVGVGTTSPSQPLHVSGAMKTTSGLLFGSTESYMYENAADSIAWRIGSDGPYITMSDGGGANLVNFFNVSGPIALGTVNAERFRIDGSGNVGIGTTSPAATLDVAGTGAVKVPVGTTAQRPTATTGLLRFNSTDGSFEGYDGSAWGSIGGGGGATGGGSDELFFENGQTMTTDYTIPATKNAMSTGPITINSGVTLTVEAGARYVVI